MVYLTGYHGTSGKSSKEIISKKKFQISNGKTEWLGKGIYFYFNYIDALNWNKNSSGIYADDIIHSIIKVDENQYLDFDTEDGARVFNEALDFFSKSVGVEFKGTPQENQCAVSNCIWDMTDVMVIAASLPIQKRQLVTLIDKRKLRREFCVRNNDCIKSIQLIERVI